MANSEKFFTECKEQSQVKTKIIAKYFWVWAKVITSTAKRNKREPKLAYIDLFAGPGRYEDGTSSTPIKVLEQTISDEDLRNCLVTVFNDKDSKFIRSLENDVKNLAGIETLKYQPQIMNNEVGEEITKTFETMKLIPTLFFVDPWGYKGLSLRLVNSVLKDWGCDCIFFFNYNRINMGINNPLVKEHIDALFGEERGDLLRSKLEGLTPQNRELLIVEELTKALKDFDHYFVLPFSFKNETGARTSHHLFFVTKSFTGYEIMKDIMARESSIVEQGVPSFMYNPADINFPNLFEYNKPLDELEEMLLSEYEGKTITMRELYLAHNVGRRYISRNYKSLLCKMEKEGKITAEPPAIRRKKNTFGDKVLITFIKR